MEIYGSSVGGGASWGTYDAAANAAALGDPNLIAQIALQDPNAFGGGAAQQNDGSGAFVGGAWSPEPAGNNAIFDGTYSANQGLTVPKNYATNYTQFTNNPAAATAPAGAAAPAAGDQPAKDAAAKKSADEAATKAAGADAAKKAAPAAPAAKTVTVKSGDTLSAIGGRVGVDWRTLYAANKGVIGGNPNMIRPGQVLSIP
ncbi:MAG: LysM peptidoglycan-binding domain-containing protein [Thermoleophilia bacterium]|nr:LysM peptidoglycan-binding domain-containing protein [Thermoleophilia bacterium]